MWKNYVILWVFVLFNIFDGLKSETTTIKSVPSVEKAPMLLSSYLPASMQVMAHVTELMKYDIRYVEDSVTTTSVRPTPHHNPGIFAPKLPFSSQEYQVKINPYQEYLNRLRRPQSSNYFDRYASVGEKQEELKPQEGILPDLESQETNPAGSPESPELFLLGREPSTLLRQINKLEDYDFSDDDDDKLLQFSNNYDDISLKGYIVGNKKIPPTRAYVTLLNLYDSLNKESKKLQLNKYGGYHNDVLQVLIETSQGTSSAQMKTVLRNLVNNRDTQDQAILKKLNTILIELDIPDSYINEALKPIPALQFLY